ncbi:MAG: hypothetical protein JO317_00590 [Verrucomicrobiae bacterium]|nr:hypothetical protein [Verrucomicrobiae bacterium]
MIKTRLLRRIQESSCEKSWAVRALFLPFFVYLGIRHARDFEYSSIFGGLDMVIHEVGHPLFSVFGEWMHVAGGTIFQLLVPLLALIVLLRQEEYFGIAFCGVWIAENLFEIAPYVADARAQELPLVTLGANTGEPVEVQHDWEYLLESFGALQRDTQIGAAIHGVAQGLLWASILIGAAIVVVMASPRLRRSNS